MSYIPRTGPRRRITPRPEPPRCVYCGKFVYPSAAGSQTHWRDEHGVLLSAHGECARVEAAKQP